mmetsp:Transcript_24191/g.68976  ORF Transcript_24191/g.68976 Transcript_24191/m.68976 type:complete len:275 (-) Transcript_24191:114-938(-)
MTVSAEKLVMWRSGTPRAGLSVAAAKAASAAGSSSSSCSAAGVCTTATSCSAACCVEAWCSMAWPSSQSSSRASRLCEKFRRIGSRSAITFARADSFRTSDEATSTEFSAITTLSWSSSCMDSLRRVGSARPADGSPDGTSAAGASAAGTVLVVEFLLPQADLAVITLPADGPTTRLPSKSSQVALPERFSCCKINLYSMPFPGGNSSGMEDHSGKVAASVFRAYASDGLHRPRLGWDPTMKTASPGRVLRHSTAKTTRAAMCPAPRTAGPPHG